MDRKSWRSIVLSLVGLIGVLALAYGSQALVKMIAAQNARLLDLNLIYLNLGSSALTSLLAVGALLGLFWIVMTRTPRWIGWVFLAVGGLLLIYPIAFFYTLQRAGWMPYVPLLSALEESLLPGSLFYGVSGGVGGIGLFKLLLSGAQKRPPSQPSPKRERGN